MSVEVKYNGRTYSFQRDTNGRGYWCPNSGRGANLIVPIIVAAQLREAARKQGLDMSLFDRRKSEEERTVRVRSKSSKIKKAKFSVSLSSLVKSINKFKGEES